MPVLCHAPPHTHACACSHVRTCMHACIPVKAPESTRHLQGNCSTAPPESMLERLRRAELPTAAVKDLIGLRPGQCLLISYEDLMPVDTPRVWIDNLYLRTVTALPGFLATPSRRKTHVSLLSAHVEKKSARRTGGAAARFVTRCTFQGDGIGPAVGIEVNEDTYVERAPPRPGTPAIGHVTLRLCDARHLAVCARLSRGHDVWGSGPHWPSACQDSMLGLSSARLLT